MIYFFLFFAVFFAAYFLFHPALALSHVSGAMDIPNERKIHSKPMARAGGFAIFVAFSAISIIVPIDLNLKIPLVLGCAFIFLIGFLDDVIDVSPFVKLTGQFLAIAVYFFLSELLNFNYTVIQGISSAIWILFIVNATNLIDGLDGLACGICASQSLCLTIIALAFGNKDVSVCSSLLLGGILGFFPRNFPRAKIFMGDCGALFLGFALAVLSSRLVAESDNILCLLSVFLIFRVPIYDTNFSIVRRLINRKNPFLADKGHFHHQLLRRGFSKECTALALITVALFFGLIGILLSILML